jgi:GT2 family glycosyltransferase
MTLAVIILNWNGKSDTLECLQSLSACETNDWKILTIVGDQGSKDGSVEAISKDFPDVTILEYDHNLGFAEGNNRAIYWAKEQSCDAIILLNNDTVVDKHFLYHLVTVWQQNDKVGAVMPLMYYYDTSDVWYAGGQFMRPWGRVQHQEIPLQQNVYKCEVFSACCILLPMAVLAKTGLFDERFYLYLEDTDLALRIQQAGYAIFVCQAAKVWHKVSRSSGGSTSPTALYYQVRNNILLIQKHLAFYLHLIGYAYVVLLSGKILYNVVRKMPKQVSVVFSSQIAAWHDAILHRWGARAL